MFVTFVPPQKTNGELAHASNALQVDLLILLFLAVVMSSLIVISLQIIIVLRFLLEYYMALNICLPPRNK